MDHLVDHQYAQPVERRAFTSHGLAIAPLRLENTTETVAAKPALNKIVTVDGNCTLHCRRD
jgi:hypothetical protein